MAAEPPDADTDRVPSIEEVGGVSGFKTFLEEADRTMLVRLLERQSSILAMLAQSVQLPTVLEELTRVVEEQFEGMACSVFLVTPDRKHLHYVAGRSLPESYTRAIDGSPIEVFLSRPSIVTDIAREAAWADYKDLALEAGFSACWSVPIVSERREVLGAFAMHHRHAFTPSSMHLGLIDLTHTLGRIGNDRDEAEQEGKRLSDVRNFADRYLALLKATGELVWTWDFETKSVQCTGGLDNLGYDDPGAASKLRWWTERIHPDDVRRTKRGVGLAIDSGKPVWMEEYRFRRKDGTYADLLARGLIVRDKTGKVVRIVGSLKDITQRKRHQREVEQLADRLRAATVAASVGTWRLDIRTQFFLADANLNRLLGRNDEESVHRFSDILRVVPPEDRDRLAQAVDASIATGLPLEIDHRVVLANGAIRWLRNRGRIVFDGQESGAALTGAVADITELKRAEQSMAILADASHLLAESLELDQTLSSIAQMAIPRFADITLVHLKDPATSEPRLAIAHAANPELHTILQEMLHAGSFRVAAPGHRVLSTGCSELHPHLTREWLLTQDVDEGVITLIRRFHVSSTIHVAIVLDGQPFGVMVFAATGTRLFEEKDVAFAEELVRRASNAIHHARMFETAKMERARAEEAGALRERLVAIVGHDLRNPLSVITFAADLLSRSELPPREGKLAQQIQASAMRMMRMIHQLLDFARIRGGGSFELDLKSVNLHQVCSDIVEELRMVTPDRSIEVDTEGNEEAVCDRDRIAEVFSNLIGNAIQHGSNGPISVRICGAEPDAVTITVHNVGPSIPMAKQATIFEAFRRGVTEAGDDDSKSVGLGLFIAKEIVRAHGGSIAVRSPDRNGTTFTVVLPRRLAATEGRHNDHLQPHRRTERGQ